MTLPVDLGLPTHFESYRPKQYETAIDLMADPKRFVLLSAPTGTGKSLIYMTAAKAIGARALVLVGTKGLQQQLMADFASSGMTDVRGQSNYRCVAVERHLQDFGRKGATCDEGPCHIGVVCNYKTEGGCLYYDAQATARESEIVVTNYAYWMTLGRHSDPSALGDFDLLILDEAHSAPDWLSSFCSVKLDEGEARHLLELELPAATEGITIWAEWAKAAHKVAAQKATESRLLLAATKDKVERYRLTRRLLRLTELVRDLMEISLAGNWKRAESSKVDVTMPGMRTDWAMEEYSDSRSSGVRFSPVWAHAYAEPYLFRGIPKVMLASATLSKDVIKYLGIDPANAYYKEITSGFDPKRRPLIYSPTVSVGRSMSDGETRMWINKMDRIIAARLDRKGIIHTRSYDRAKLILERSKYAELMMPHTSRNTRDVVAKFKKADAPAILISPSIEEGFDFPGDECRYQIIAKVPFVDPRGPLMKARTRTDKHYLNYITALSLIQMVGRGMRSSDDRCETFLIDDNFAWFRKAAERHFPKWFRLAWKWEDKLREPFVIGS